MPIPVEKKFTSRKKKCFFCPNKTEFAHVKTLVAVCDNCARTHAVRDIRKELVAKTEGNAEDIKDISQ